MRECMLECKWLVVAPWQLKLHRRAITIITITITTISITTIIIIVIIIINIVINTIMILISKKSKIPDSRGNSILTNLWP